MPDWKIVWAVIVAWFILGVVGYILIHMKPAA